VISGATRLSEKRKNDTEKGINHSDKGRQKEARIILTNIESGGHIKATIFTVTTGGYNNVRKTLDVSSSDG
jgi:hypothetical protein